MRTGRNQPRFTEADNVDERPFADRTRASDQPPITQVSGFGGDSRTPRAREEFGERTRLDQPSPRFFADTDPDERTRLSQPRFCEDSAGPERTRLSQPRFSDDSAAPERTRLSQPRFSDDSAGPERTRLSQPRYSGDEDSRSPAGPERTRMSQPRLEEPDGFGARRGFTDSPRFDDEVDDRTVQRQDLGGGPGFPGGPSTVKLNTHFGNDPGSGSDPGFDAARGFDTTRGYGGPRTFDGPAAFGSGPADAAPAGRAPAGSEWNFRDTGPDTGAFQDSYGGNGSSAGNSGYPPAFRDQAGSGQSGTFQNGPGTPGPYARDDRGFSTDSPFGQGGQTEYPGRGAQPAERKRSRKVPVLIGAGVLVVALGAGGAVVAPTLLKHTDPGCTAYTSNALPAYNHAISDLNAQASQASLETDLTTAIGQLTAATGQANGTEVKTALQNLLTQLKQVQSDVKKGAVPHATVTSLNTASTVADNAC